jgi:hypothetical protein
MAFPGWADPGDSGTIEGPQGPREGPSQACVSQGPVDELDPSEGFLDYEWRAYFNKPDVFIQNMTTGGPAISIYQRTNIDHLTLTFDQQGRSAIAFIDGGEVFLRWYDPIAADYVVTNFGPASICFLSLDDKRRIQMLGGYTEMVLCYQRGESAFLRLQSERFETEHATPLASVPGLKVTNIGLSNVSRFQIDYIKD